MSALTLVATISCRHGYFADGIAAALSLHPDSATTALMAQFGLVFHRSANGGTVYASDNAKLATLPEDATLVLMLDCADPSLLNCTARPLDAAEPWPSVRVQLKRGAAVDVRVEFAARATVWRYTIRGIDPAAHPTACLLVEPAQHPPLHFRRAANTAGDAGVLQFLSDRPVELSDHATAFRVTFELAAHRPPIHLPQPEGRQPVTPDPTAPLHGFSDVYVTL